MQPYMNPNYFQQPMYQQQNFQPNVIPNSGTRMVNDFNEIQVNEIPMDGSYKLFAKKDMSEVQARAWLSNGTIGTIQFKAVPNDDSVNNQETDFNALFEPIMAEIRALSDKVDKLSRPTNTTASKSKKEVVDNV